MRTSDIDRQNMVIHVRQGKGRKDRYVMLSEQLLNILSNYWRKTRPPGSFLFPGLDRKKPITSRQLQRVLRVAADAAGLQDTATPHTLRHSFATHLLEQGVDIRIIQDLLGHRNINTTTRYTRVALETIRNVQSPLESLNMQGLDPG